MVKVFGVALMALAVAGGAQQLPNGAVTGWNLGWLGDVAFSPAGDLLAIGGSAGVHVYQVGTWKLVRQLPSENPVFALAFSSDGTWLAGGFWNEVRVWEANSGQLVATLTAQTGIVKALAFTDQGELLVGGADGSLLLWDAQAQVIRWKHQAHTTQVRTIAFSPDRTLFVTSGVDQALIWDAATYTVVHTIPGKAWDVVFTPDGYFLVMGWGKLVRLWDTAVWLMYREMWGHESCAVAVAVAPQGSWVASGSLDETARLWDCEAGTCVKVLPGHGAPVSCVTFSPDGRFLVTGADNGTIWVWNFQALLP